MKVQVLKDISECIDGYNPVFIEDNTINIDCPNNSINEILMINTIEEISCQYVEDFLKKLRTLLRVGGKIVITGIDINCLSRDLINKIIDSDVYNQIIYNRRGIYSCKELAEKLNSLGIQIDKMTFKGSTYELHAIRNN